MWRVQVVELTLRGLEGQNQDRENFTTHVSTKSKQVDPALADMYE